VPALTISHVHDVRQARRGRRRADVAVYAPFAGPLYEPEPGPVAGAEVQSGQLARALVEQGLRVVHVVQGANLVAERDGVDVLPLPAGYDAGGLVRRRTVLQALREADARLYVQRSAGFETGWVALYAKATGRRFVFSSSSTGDFVRDRRVAELSGASLDEWPTRVQYLFGLHAAHAVVVQTDEQRFLARSERGVEARVIRSFCEPAPAQAQPRDAFLWLGGLVGSKDPVSYVELARRVPEARFLMVATDRGETWAKLAHDVRARAEATPNLDVLSALDREVVLALYYRAVAVVSTSWFEGFPNTFLESWARGAPVLSLRVDPDSVIEQHQLGAACHGSLDELAAAARRLWGQRESIDPAPFRDYVARVHDPAVVGRQWASLVQELLER